MKFHGFLFLLPLAVCATALADSYGDYISRYAEMAVSQQERHGIPASITLAQGLLESRAGRSRLASEGNNHFGIKCHTEWQGDTMILSDDRPDDCFRVYHDVEESFDDHSRFLKRKRYQTLFDLEPTDYAGWARGLKSCGYATDPHYADRLITIIERYALYMYDNGNAARAEETAEFIRSQLLACHPVCRSRGLHYVVAVPGDTYTSLAKEFRIKREKLMEYNDAGREDKIRPWEEVYLQPKLTTAPEGVATAVIGETETLHSIAQRFGMTEKEIRRLNPDASDSPGTTLRLR